MFIFYTQDLLDSRDLLFGADADLERLYPQPSTHMMLCVAFADTLQHLTVAQVNALLGKEEVGYCVRFDVGLVLLELTNAGAKTPGNGLDSLDAQYEAYIINNPIPAHEVPNNDIP